MRSLSSARFSATSSKQSAQPPATPAGSSVYTAVQPLGPQSGRCTGSTVGLYAHVLADQVLTAQCVVWTWPWS